MLDEYDERVLIGELYLPIKRLVVYYGVDGMGCHLPFNFSLLLVDWNARTIAKLIDDYEERLPAGGWPNWVLGNHDRPRVASRVGREQRYRLTPAPMAEAVNWIADVGAEWDERLERLRKQFEKRGR